MTKHLKTLFLLFFILPLHCLATTNNLASTKLNQLLSQFTTLKANFAQTTSGLKQRSVGTVMIMRPGRFRWEIQKPMHQIIIANGNQLWIYDVSLKQATHQSLQQSTFTPAKLLSGNISKVLKHFTINMTGSSHDLIFQLLPHHPNQQARSILLKFSHDKLQSITIRTGLNQTTVFQFSHVQLNTHLSSDLFQFRAPPGVDVMQ